MTKLFGTNGVRGEVNKDMTIDLAARLAKSIGSWLGGGTVSIGTDTRLSNQMLKSAVIAGLTATGCDVVDLGEAPTPAIQLYTRENTDLGIGITASHNPPKFNGIKCVDSDGTELIKSKEEEIEKIFFDESYKLVDWSKVGRIRTDDPVSPYNDAVIDKIDHDKIRNAKLKVVVDCANGVGALSTPVILRELGCSVITLNAQPDGTFPGHDSEPTEENLKDLIEMVKATGADLGIANDGDADRAIFIDEKGNFMHGDRTLTLIAKREVKEHGGGIVVTPVSSSSSVEDVVVEEGGTLIYTAVGSPIVAREMIKQGAIFGGEENGGLIFSDHQYCRDAAMSAARIVEMIATGGPLSEMVSKLPNYSLDKRGFPCPDELKESMMERLKSFYSDEEYDDTDGLKILYDDGWVLIRPSGTEPKYRIYSEAADDMTAQRSGKKHFSEAMEILSNLK